MSDYRVQPNYSFTDIYESNEVFYNGDQETDVIGWSNCPFYKEGLLSRETIDFIYYLLYANYGNSHILSSDISRFQFKLMATVYQHAPLWLKKTEIQERLRNMSEDELREGNKAIHNTAMHDASAPSQDSLDELTYIDSQNTTKYKRSKIDAYASLLELLSNDVTEEFMNKFKNLFQNVVSLQQPILYEEEN